MSIGTGRLEVVRQTQLFAAAHAVSVAVDGRSVGTLRSGGHLGVDLPPGRHTIVCEYSRGRTSGEVDIEDGRTAECHIAISKFNSALKVTISD